MNINEQFNNEDSGPSVKTITLYRIFDGFKVNELLVDSENRKIIFYNGKGGYKKNDYMKNMEMIDILLPRKSIKLNEKGEYFWKKGEWQQIKNFIKFYNIFIN